MYLFFRCVNYTAVLFLQAIILYLVTHADTAHWPGHVSQYVNVNVNIEFI